ncbi:hypothetical protein MKEN_00719100 [Mycena kentingensis (nom. inval.)]|nr:hypothetical protein MKEN_00719100 [Mycena kentingensis (nom. inval.)]
MSSPVLYLSAANTAQTRKHPRLTPYRAGFLLTTMVFGTLQYAESWDDAKGVPASTVGYVYGAALVCLFYWLGLYEHDCPGQFPWLFELDLLELPHRPEAIIFLRRVCRAASRTARALRRGILTIIFELLVQLASANVRVCDPDSERGHGGTEVVIIDVESRAGTEIAVGVSSGVQRAGVATVAESSVFIRRVVSRLQERSDPKRPSHRLEFGNLKRFNSARSPFKASASTYADTIRSTRLNPTIPELHDLRSAFETPQYTALISSSTLTRPGPQCMCDRSFRSPYALERHMHETQSHICKRCNPKFDDLSSLGMQFASPGFVKWVEELLFEYGL